MHEVQAAAYLVQNVARNIGFAATHVQAAKKGLRFIHGQTGQLGNGLVAPFKRKRHRVQALAVAAWAFHGFAVVAVVPAVFLARLFLVEAGQLQARTKAVLAPAVLGVVGEHAWVRLGEAGAAAGAGPFDGEMLLAGIGQRLTLSALFQRHGTRWRQGSQHTEGAVT